MSLPQILLIIAVIFSLAVGQVLFKQAATDLIFTPKDLLITMVNVRLVAALAIYGVATILWLYVLKFTPLKMAYPFFGLTFVIVPTLSYFFINEELSWHTYAGGLVIGLGIWISIQ